MNPMPSPESQTLPIVDISPFLSSQSSLPSLQATASSISTACRDFGFFYLTGHGVPTATTERVLELARKFFLNSTGEEKFAIARKEVNEGGDGARGYQRIGENVTIGKRDWHEAVDLYAEWGAGDEKQVSGQDGVCTGPNLWPSNPAELKSTYEAYIEDMKRVGTAVVRAMGWGLGLDEKGEESREVFVNNTRKSFWVMRMIGYPPLPGAEEEGNNRVNGSQNAVDESGLHDDADVEQFSCGTHTDYGCVTLLLADATPHALQVQRKDGTWIYAEPIPGAFVVNIGDMIERWTNGMWKSTRHRVIHKGTGFRVSVPFFFEPDWNSNVKPLEKCISESKGEIFKGGAEPVMYGEHLVGKIKGNFY